MQLCMLLAAGADDGGVRLFDLRQSQAPTGQLQELRSLIGKKGLNGRRPLLELVAAGLVVHEQWYGLFCDQPHNLNVGAFKCASSRVLNSGSNDPGIGIQLPSWLQLCTNHLSDLLPPCNLSPPLCHAPLSLVSAHSGPAFREPWPHGARPGQQHLSGPHAATLLCNWRR